LIGFRVEGRGIARHGYPSPGLRRRRGDRRGHLGHGGVPPRSRARIPQAWAACAAHVAPTPTARPRDGGRHRARGDHADRLSAGGDLDRVAVARDARPRPGTRSTAASPPRPDARQRFLADNSLALHHQPSPASSGLCSSSMSCRRGRAAPPAATCRARPADGRIPSPAPSASRRSRARPRRPRAPGSRRRPRRVAGRRDQHPLARELGEREVKGRGEVAARPSPATSAEGARALHREQPVVA